ncbi:MAG: 23S rRNA (adenine(2503)-C(2))-methyltransferase RlmN [Nitrospirota bacterium]|nr:23S rRNA (adenine(2503)-C(2))-methyltransferase RlmN [Nitrospirota bacterium]
MPPPADLKDLTPAEIEQYCSLTLGLRPGAGSRTAALLYRHRIEDLGSMTSLSRRIREVLTPSCTISRIVVERIEESSDGTRKLLYRLHDGNAVEGVLIPGRDRLTLCISTQVGCASGCLFCLTGGAGLVRNLSHAEIVNQVFAATALAGPDRISNLVLMGTGEPLSNYDRVRRFITTATDHSGLAFSTKRVTISTCGLAPMIERLADDDVPASLAVSLNATTDEVRDRIMPVNKVYPIEQLIGSLRYYAAKSGRTVTIEYVLFKGVNDSLEDAHRLIRLLKDLPSMVNLLLFNPFPGAPFDRPDAESVAVFRDVLVRNKIIVVVRRSRGRDISAACGQLRARQQAAPK